MTASHATDPPEHRAIRQAYKLMRARFGHQGWWPAMTPFEVCLGAILTQNTSWSNVERAIENLRTRNLLDPRRLAALSRSALERCIRPAGCSRVKARRLRAFLEVVVNRCGGDLSQLWRGPIPEARDRLLAIHGIGPETADGMLLYAGQQPSFVVDAYTVRIFTRHGWCPARPSYQDVQQLAQTALNHSQPGRKLDLWQDCHAQLVMTGKRFCRSTNPRCGLCPLQPLLPTPPHDLNPPDTTCLAPANRLITRAERGPKLP